MRTYTLGWLVIFSALLFAARPSHADNHALLYISNGINDLSALDTDTNQIIASNTASAIQRAVVSPDGGKIYAQTNNGGVALDSRTNKVVFSFASERGFAINADGTKLYSTVFAGTPGNDLNYNLLETDTATGNITKTFSLNGATLEGDIAVSPDGSKIYVGTAVYQLFIVDTNSGVVSTIATGLEPTILKLSKDGTKLYVGYPPHASHANVQVFSTGTNTVVANFPDIYTNSMALSPDGTKLYLTDLTQTNVESITVISTSSDLIIASIKAAQTPGPIAISPSGSSLYTVDQRNSTVAVIDTGTNAIVDTISVPNAPYGITIFSGPARAQRLQAAILPLTRSVVVGATATVFATIVNAGPDVADNCGIAPTTAIPAAFSFQTTDATTNSLTGTINAPVSIAENGAQSFLLAFTTNGTFAPTDLTFDFSCTNATSAPPFAGVNNLQLSASLTAVPDIVAISATPSNDGILALTNSTGAFAIAVTNVGSAGPLTARADTNSTVLPLTLTLCQTNPATGACLASPTTSITTNLGGNATATYSIFASKSGAIPFAPGTNRIFVRFIDAGGLTRGATSVAVSAP